MFFQSKTKDTSRKLPLAPGRDNAYSRGTTNQKRLALATLDSLQTKAPRNQVISRMSANSAADVILKSSLFNPWTAANVALNTINASPTASRGNSSFSSLYWPLLRIHVSGLLRNYAEEEVANSTTDFMIEKWTHDPLAMGSESSHQEIRLVVNQLKSNYPLFLHSSEELISSFIRLALSVREYAQKNVSPHGENSLAPTFGLSFSHIALGSLIEQVRNKTLIGLQKNTMEMHRLECLTGTAVVDFSSEDVSNWRKSLSNSTAAVNYHKFLLNILPLVPMAADMAVGQIAKSIVTRILAEVRTYFPSSRSQAALDQRSLHNLFILAGSAWTLWRSAQSLYSLYSRTLTVSPSVNPLNSDLNSRIHLKEIKIHHNGDESSIGALRQALAQNIPGRWTLAGPNGAGKTSLLKLLKASSFPDAFIFYARSTRASQGVHADTLSSGQHTMKEITGAIEQTEYTTKAVFLDEWRANLDDANVKFLNDRLETSKESFFICETIPRFASNGSAAGPKSRAPVNSDC